MYLAYTINGIEDIAEKELHGKMTLPRRIKFSKLKKSYGSVNRIIKIIKSFEFNSLEDILRIVKKSRFPIKETFKVECEREGDHNFRSIDIELNCGKIIRSKGYEVDLKKPSNIIFVDIYNNKCFIGILIKDRLCKRQYRIRINNKSINACLAHAMLKIADIKKGESMLDPFCKDGIIPIEAARMKIKKIFASDAVKNNIKNAIINSKLAKAKIKFENFDITWLDTKFRKDSVDKIVTNLFISRIDLEPDKLIREFFNQAKYIVKKNIVLITNKPEIVKSNFENSFAFKKERKIQIGEMYYSILEFVKN